LTSKTTTNKQTKTTSKQTHKKQQKITDTFKLIKINTLYDFKIKDAMLEFVLFYCRLFSMYFGSLQFPSVYAVALCTICKLAQCIIHNIRRGRNRMVVVFTTTYAISTNHH
jgi:hypothetical protein